MNKIFQILEGHGLKDIFSLKKMWFISTIIYRVLRETKKYFILLKSGKRRKETKRKITIEIKNSKRMTSPRRLRSISDNRNNIAKAPVKVHNFFEGNHKQSHNTEWKVLRA